MASDTSGSVPLLPTQLCRGAGDIVILCTESLRQHEVHAHEELPLKNLVDRELLLYEGFSKSLSAGPYAGQAMGQRERTPSGHTGSLSLMDGKEMLQATSSRSLNE